MSGRDRVGEGDRAFDRDLVLDPELLGQLLSVFDAASGEQPVLLARLLLPAEQDASAPAEHCRDADARLSHLSYTLEEPKPRTPRSLSGSSSTSTSSISGRRMSTSWAIRISGSIVKESARSVLSTTTRSSPR